MEKEFVPYNLNRELYALGYRPERKAFAYYTTPYHPTLNSGVLMYENPDPVYESELKKTNKKLMYNSAILWQEAFRWFREKHSLISSVTGIFKDETKTDFEYWYYILQESDEEIFYKTYEEAELACLRKLIKIVKDEKRSL